MKLFLERIHASLLIQLSHSDDSLIPYVGSCIYRRDLVYILPENWVPTLVAWMGCSSACYTRVSCGLVEDEISRLQQCMQW